MLTTRQKWVTLIAIFTTAFLLYSGKVHAKATILDKDAPAPYHGILLEPADFLKARIYKSQAESFKAQLDEYAVLTKINNNRLTNRDETIGLLNNQLENGKIFNIYYFIGGVVLGGLVGHSIH